MARPFRAEGPVPCRNRRGSRTTRGGNSAGRAPNPPSAQRRWHAVQRLVARWRTVDRLERRCRHSHRRAGSWHHGTTLAVAVVGMCQSRAACLAMVTARFRAGWVAVPLGRTIPCWPDQLHRFMGRIPATLVEKPPSQHAARLERVGGSRSALPFLHGVARRPGGRGAAPRLRCRGS